MSVEGELAVLLDELGIVRRKIADLKADMVEVKERLGLLGSQFANLDRRLERTARDVALIRRAVEA